MEFVRLRVAPTVDEMISDWQLTLFRACGETACGDRDDDAGTPLPRQWLRRAFPPLAIMGERREADGSSICRVRVHRVPSGDVFGLQLPYHSGCTARPVTAGPTARIPESGSLGAKAATVGSGGDAARSRGRIRRLCVDR